ncbi:hypothetical protein C9I98_24765 [Photobacterium sanctipauli]|uniref:Uncharacterized protein n=1 Tax=Photobacterium sanctipauli TaxID=1342794 RepID=A0A2T3NAH2_9GAMM|nr:hypothetical protein [Photobacterium sanctipauli]PSW10738.1 hypothetical protein C9I98_24765 [Photobacterium sanctipauli]
MADLLDGYFFRRKAIKRKAQGLLDIVSCKIVLVEYRGHKILGHIDHPEDYQVCLNGQSIKGSIIKLQNIIKQCH